MLHHRCRKRGIEIDSPGMAPSQLQWLHLLVERRDWEAAHWIGYCKRGYRCGALVPQLLADTTLVACNDSELRNLFPHICCKHDGGLSPKLKLVNQNLLG